MLVESLKSEGRRRYSGYLLLTLFVKNFLTQILVTRKTITY